MSPMTILGTAGILIGSIAAGAGLGSFATTSPAGRWHSGEDVQSRIIQTASTGVSPVSSAAAAGSLAPRGPITCKGCGPTLAERKMAVEEAQAMQLGHGTGAYDPVVQRYLHDADAEDAQWKLRDAQRAATVTSPTLSTAAATVAPPVASPVQMPVVPTLSLQRISLDNSGMPPN